MNATNLSRMTGAPMIGTPAGDVAPGELRTLGTRRSILAAARELLRAEGHQSFSMEGVAALAGVTRRTVCNLFPGRDSLYCASRADLLREFEHLLPLDGAGSGALRTDLEDFGRRALAALATNAHRELLASVRRDAAMSWLAGFYQDRVEQPLCRLLEEILARHAPDSASGHCTAQAASGVALLRAATGETDAPTLGPHEFAWLVAARLGASDPEGTIEEPPPADAESAKTSLQPERRPMIRRGAVAITFDPVDVRWNGVRVALSPLEGQLFALVAQRGRVPWADIDRLLDVRHSRTNSREVLIFRLRRKFAEIGAGDPLETVRGWGLRFRTEPDARGSRTLWIGVSEADAADR
ncbi:hypothetical protein GCM10009087_35960 [Sphingomonas oligophenolica]|uniref:TetR family transcriptional regulator n=1 Tax=Sphingomonas oligophenolica TaxID=301154 RepID=A0ABU9Y9A0_9SPHN